LYTGTEYSKNTDHDTTLREEHKLRVSENRVLRRIFGPKREGDGSWRKLDNNKLHSLYSSPNILC
jgi:hypothetical protein